MVSATNFPWSTCDANTVSPNVLVSNSKLSLPTASDFVPLCDMGRTQAGWFPVTVFRKKDSGFREKLEDICFARDICKGCMRFSLSGRTLFDTPPQLPLQNGWTWGLYKVDL